MKRSVLVLNLLFVSTAFGWGPDGHRIVGEIAWQELNPQVKEKINALLAEDPDYKDLDSACNWADEIKSDRSWDWARPLHYTDIEGTPGEPVEDMKSYDQERDCNKTTDCPGEVPCPTHRCVVEAIPYYQGVLADPDTPDKDRLIALKFLAHFVGDLHQPLHAGYAIDKGGNDVHVKFFNQSTNLHVVWDSLLIRRKTTDWKQYANELEAAITDGERKAWQSDLDPADWATESHRACARLYQAIPKNGELGQTYYDKMIPVVDTQLSEAGVRLAAVLNQALADSPLTHTAPAASPPG